MVKVELPDLYTKKDVDNARTKGEVVGWIKGGVVGVVGMLLLGVVRWIPTLVVMGIAGIVIYKLFAGGSKSS